MIRENLNPDVDIEGILPTLVDSRTIHAKEAIEILEENFGDRVFASRIRKTVRFAEAPVKGMSVLKYDPKGVGGRRLSPAGEGGSLEWQAHKRASMREGPLAALFRKTDGGRDAACGGRRADARRSARARAAAADAAEPELPGRRAARRAAPQERLRAAFSSDIPANVMEPAPARRAGARAGARARAPAAVGASVHAHHRAAGALSPAQPVGTPVLRVVGVGGAGVNAVNRMVEAEVARRRVHRPQHRPAVAAAVRRGPHAAHRRRGHARARLGLQPRRSAARRRWRTTTRSRRCSRARTWSSSRPAPAAARARARRPSSRASPASSAR